MYLTLKPMDPISHENMSWILRKNPNTNVEYKVDLGKTSGIAIGKYSDISSRIYEITVNVDPIQYLKVAKERNLPSYVTVHTSAVTPSSLKGMVKIFRSAINGDVDKEVCKEVVEYNGYYRMNIGPLSVNYEYINRCMQKVGLVVYQIFYEGCQYAYSISITNNHGMPLYEFLQKIYIILYIATKEYNLVKLDTDYIKKMIKLSEKWINKHEDIKNTIVNSITKKHKGFTKQFEETIISNETDEEKKQELQHNFEEYIGKKSLSEVRYEAIANLIEIIDPQHTVLDMGCGSGQLEIALRKLKKKMIPSILGIDKDLHKIQHMNSIFSKNKNVKAVCGNIICPPLSPTDLTNIDVLILCEVIEHLSEQNRMDVIKLISKILPRHIIITTPNVEYNKNYNIEPGEYRHKDHKIEYNKDQLNNEIIIPLIKNGYNVYQLNLLDQEEQPTFYIHAELNDKEKKPDIYYLSELSNKYSDFHLPHTNYIVKKKDIIIGSTYPSVSNNIDNIFFLSPTIAPVEYNRIYEDYLEHPMSAIEYYQQRGITKLVAEHKYMGSRAHILWFKNAEHAALFGYEQLTVISRNGYNFFLPEQMHFYDSIKEELSNVNIEEDFIILDAEIMPWSLKAKNLIKYEYILPGECDLIDKTHKNVSSDRLTNTTRFLNVVSHYGDDTPLEIRSFHVLATGKINIDKKRFTEIKSCFCTTHSDQLLKIRKLFSGKTIFKLCEEYDINTEDWTSVYKVINTWYHKCNVDLLEGFVIKPLNYNNFSQDDYIIQPALKVRGKEYLRMIYGINYLDDEYFKEVSRRNIKRKRLMAAQQHELSRYILNSFLRRNNKMREKYIWAFLGMETVNYSNVDATL